MESSKDMKLEIIRARIKKQNLQGMYQSILVFAGTFIGAFTGFSVFRFVQNISHLGEYEIQAIFWIFHLLLPSAIIIVCLSGLFLYLNRLKKKLKKLENIIPVE